eukprot:jgi/Tetstr1/458843/TSEL_004352.t1
MQALKMQLDGLSTQLEIMEELNQQRASPATNDDEGKGGNETVHDARAVDATEDDDGDDDCAKFFDPHNWLDDLPRAYHDILPRPLGVRHTNLFKSRHNEHGRSANGVDGFLTGFDDKRPEVGLAATAEATHAAALFKNKEREEDPNTAASRKIKNKPARGKRKRERREGEAKNKNDKGDNKGKSKGKANE